MSNHYRQGFGESIETLRILRDKLTPEQFTGFCLGNIIKYSTRANFKGSFKQDVDKAEHYGRILKEYLDESNKVKPIIPRWPKDSLPSSELQSKEG